MFRQKTDHTDYCSYYNIVVHGRSRATVHTKPPPACALVVLTRSSSALRAKTAYVGGGYEFCPHSGIGNSFLHAGMTMRFPIPEYGVNRNGQGDKFSGY